MNIFTLPQTLPNSAYTLASKPVITPVNINIPLHVNQAQFRDNNVQLIKADNK